MSLQDYQDITPSSLDVVLDRIGDLSPQDLAEVSRQITAKILRNQREQFQPARKHKVELLEPLLKAWDQLGERINAAPRKLHVRLNIMCDVDYNVLAHHDLQRDPFEFHVRQVETKTEVLKEGREPSPFGSGLESYIQSHLKSAFNCNWRTILLFREYPEMSSLRDEFKAIEAKLHEALMDYRFQDIQAIREYIAEYKRDENL